MLTSAPGSSAPARAQAGPQAGLTLIEVLVVIGLMGLMTAIVVLTVPPRAGEAELAARAFSREVASLADQAVVRGRTVGLGEAEGGLSAYAYADGWAPSRALAGGEGLRTALTPADEVLPPDPVPTGTLLVYRPPGEEAAPEVPPPPVLFAPTGEVTPFAARFEGDRETWVVTVGAFGEAEVARAR